MLAYYGVSYQVLQTLDDLFGAKDVVSPTVSLAVVNLLLHLAAAGKILIVSNTDAEVEAMTLALEERFGSITIQEGEMMPFVGTKIITDVAGNTRLRQQRGYIADVLNHFGVQSSQTAEHYCTGNIMDPAKSSEADYDVAAFKSGVMKLKYLSTRRQ